MDAYVNREELVAELEIALQRMALAQQQAGEDLTAGLAAATFGGIEHKIGPPISGSGIEMPFQVLQDETYDYGASTNRRVKIVPGYWKRLSGPRTIEVGTTTVSTHASAATPHSGDYCVSDTPIADGDTQWWYVKLEPSSPLVDDTAYLDLNFSSSRPSETATTELLRAHRVKVLAKVTNTGGLLTIEQEWVGDILDTFVHTDALLSLAVTSSPIKYAKTLSYAPVGLDGVAYALQDYLAQETLVDGEAYLNSTYPDAVALAYYVKDTEGVVTKNYADLDTNAPKVSGSAYKSLEKIPADGYGRLQLRNFLAGTPLTEPEDPSDLTGITFVVRAVRSGGTVVDTEFVDLSSFKPDNAGHADSSDAVDASGITWDSFSGIDGRYWKTAGSLTAVGDGSQYATDIAVEGNVYSSHTVTAAGLRIHVPTMTFYNTDGSEVFHMSSGYNTSIISPSAEGSLDLRLRYLTAGDTSSPWQMLGGAGLYSDAYVQAATKFQVGAYGSPHLGATCATSFKLADSDGVVHEYFLRGGILCET